MNEHYQRFYEWMREKRLLHIEIVLPRRGRQSFFGRLIQYDTGQESLLVYNDDQKALHHIKLNEIENIETAEELKPLDFPQ